MVVALLLIERLAVPEEPDAAGAPSDVAADELGAAGAGEAGAAAAVVPPLSVPGADAVAAPPHATSNVVDKTNTAVTALDDFMRLLLVERIPYVAEQRHFIMTDT
jgi:hypothetical protein